MTTLRPYQSEAVAAVWRYLESNPGNPCVELPTGSGKTPVLVALARDVEAWGGRVLILAHVKELLAQAVDKFRSWWPEAPVGLYSAGLGRRDTDHDILIAGIQSVYRRAAELGRFDLIIIDECHLIPADGDGMYRALIKDLLIINPTLRIVGLTATPYRLDSGSICAPGNILTDICYSAHVRGLIDQGFLCKLRGKACKEADISGVHSRGGDYIQGELDAALSDDEIVRRAVADIVRHCATRKAWVVFCAGVAHAAKVSTELSLAGIDAPVITGETPSEDRDRLIAAFKAGAVRALCNINVLSIGFDAPHIDAVVMLRPTQSPGLYYQQVGRGLRTSPGKPDCLVLDLAGNVRRHGPIDMIEATKPAEGEGDMPYKYCPQCDEVVPAGVTTCPECGFEFPPRIVVKHAAVAEDVSPLVELRDETYDVQDMSYRVWSKRDAAPGAPKTLCVEYHTGRFASVREWVCVEHEGYARAKALAWWRERTSEPFPASAAAAVQVCHAGKLKEPTKLVVRVGGKYTEIRKHIYAGPCTSCKHFDGAHCNRWGLDVPAEHREPGCDGHEPLPEAAVPQSDADEPPF